ncbi:MAG TPA: 4-hydroxy-tetrahydrodipicolinate reductase [Rhizomicrobium sp.]|jgi:4-hydroxy-tetrahydrodipicolinate reductase
MTQPIRTVIAGAHGRMGRVLLRAVLEDPRFKLIGALDAPGSAGLGQDAGALAGCAPADVVLTCDPLPPLAAADALIDFSTPAASMELAALAAQARIVHVIGTTGFSFTEEARLAAAARHAVIVKSGNMSLGVTLLASLVRRAAAILPDFDVEIVEMHHRMKVDSPSGTALLLGRAAAEGRDIAFENSMTPARHGNTGARGNGAIGFASLRGGTVVGEHEVILAGPHERIVLGHVAEDRSIFARGALTAALWGQGKKPGLYGIADVLGLAE